MRLPDDKSNFGNGANGDDPEKWKDANRAGGEDNNGFDKWDRLALERWEGEGGA